MQATTVKRLVILIAILGLIGGASFWIHHVQLNRMSDVRLEQANVAVQQGDFIKAERLYAEYLEIMPDDLDVKMKFADALLKVAKTPKRQAQALEIYSDIVKRDPGREEAHRRLMELQIELQQFSEARGELSILLRTAPGDGHLQFLMGMCCENARDDSNALDHYQKAIECNAPERFEAYQRRASLLRELGNTKDAEESIEKMVQSDSGNYRVYLERGRYRRRFNDLKNALGDFRTALQLASDKPEVYEEIAEATEQEASAKQVSRANARQLLEDGIKAVPRPVGLYEALARLDLRAGQSNKAVEVLELGLKSMPDQVRLRGLLAAILAQRGDTGKLLLQIHELQNAGYSPVVLQYLNAHYYVNTHNYMAAKQLLLPLLAEVGQNSSLKVSINNLLVRCYKELGEPEMAQAANLRALSSNPNDLTAKLNHIADQRSHGNIDGAIQGLEELIGQEPRLRHDLVLLLIEKNRRLPEPQRNWSAADRLIEAMSKDAPDSFLPVILRAELLLAQGKPPQAEDELRKARARFPQNVELWNAQSDLVRMQGRVDEALSLLDDAERQLGDRVELRLQRARLWATKKGPSVVPTLDRLAQNIEKFTREDRHKLLRELKAINLGSLQNLKGAHNLLSQLADEDQNSIELRLELLDLAFRTANKDEIEKNIKEIERIEGNDRLHGPYCQARYLIFQAAQRAREKKLQESAQLRTAARMLLNELSSRRQAWSVIPLALAELEEQELALVESEEQELAQSKLDDEQKRQAQENIVARKRQKQESIADSYLRAVDLGQREATVVRRAVDLLFATGRSSDAVQLLNKIPVTSQLAGDLGRYVTQFAVRDGDYPRAEELARKAVAANPGSFQERLWLVQILRVRQKNGEAETELRNAVEFDKSDPNRWLALVLFMIQANDVEKAEQAVRDAKANLPQPKGLLALAQCCEYLGSACAGWNKDDLMEKWYAEARQWYEKAQAAQINDMSVARLHTGFLLKTGQIKQAEAKLEAILKRDGKATNPAMAVWAKRALALTLASSNDPERVHRALSLLEPTDGTHTTSQGSTNLEDPEDLRALAVVLGAQKTLASRKRAVEILESLVAKNLANPEDYVQLARALEAKGDWPRAKEQYRELILRTESIRDPGILNRRSSYLAEFAGGLLRHREAEDDQDLREAQKLVDKLKQLQKDTLILEVELKLARNQIDEAVKLIEPCLERPNLTPAGCIVLGELAEKVSRFELAERFYRRLDKISNSLQGKCVLGRYLARRGRVREALDLFEQLWSKASEPKQVAVLAPVCIEMVLGTTKSPDSAQLERVASWLEQALKRDSHATALVMGMGNIRERQKRYKEAEALYRQAISQGDRNGVSYNNLAWLMVLKDGNGTEALKYINNAIELQGPNGAYLPDFLDTRGVIYLSIQGENQRAIVDLQKAVEVAPTPSRYFHLAQAFLAANDKGKARQNLQMAKTKGLGPDDLHPLEQPTYQKVLRDLGM
jgi:predicted Zn-dependent protease